LVSWDSDALRTPATAYAPTLAVIFAMEIHPLLDIVETKEQWREDVVDLARQELIERGISNKIQETRRNNKTKFRQRIEKIKARATYTALEKILIVLLGPFLLFLLDDLFLFDSGEGYKKKNRQGLFYLILGFGLWGLTIYVSIKSLE